MTAFKIGAASVGKVRDVVCRIYPLGCFGGIAGAVIVRKDVVETVRFLRKNSRSVSCGFYSEKASDRYIQDLCDLGKEGNVGKSQAVLPFGDGFIGHRQGTGQGLLGNSRGIAQGNEAKASDAVAKADFAFRAEWRKAVKGKRIRKERWY